MIFRIKKIKSGYQLSRQKDEEYSGGSEEESERDREKREAEHVEY